VRTAARQDGFSILELLATLAIVGVLATIALPSGTRTINDLRLRGDARSLHNTVALAKMRAAARFSRERVYADLGAGTYHLQYWDKTAGDWLNEDDKTVELSSGVAFGYGGLGTPPPNTQAAIGQSTACLTKANAPISSSACIVFNSRGIPVDGTGSPTGNNAFYITDGSGTYAVTLSATPLIRLWWTKASEAQWIHR
jgi:prepilin-type N-terminal cleavage/methylation domain-containing protein